MMVHYALHHDKIGTFDFEIGDDYFAFNFESYVIGFNFEKDKMAILLKKLGLLTDNQGSDLLSVEIVPNENLFDALERLVQESVILCEEVGD